MAISTAACAGRIKLVVSLSAIAQSEDPLSIVCGRTKQAGIHSMRQGRRRSESVRVMNEGHRGNVGTNMAGSPRGSQRLAWELARTSRSQRPGAGLHVSAVSDDVDAPVSGCVVGRSLSKCQPIVLIAPPAPCKRASATSSEQSRQTSSLEARPSMTLTLLVCIVYCGPNQRFVMSYRTRTT